jgi:hypothetical protein
MEKIIAIRQRAFEAGFEAWSGFKLVISASEP